MISLVRRVLGSSPMIYLIVVVDAVFLIFAGLTVTQTSRLLYRHARERAEAAAKAVAEAGEARLAALQSQLNPHFLFNALNTVASLVRTNPQAAEHTVENLSDVLRRTLERTADLFRTLGDEIEYLRAYLAIEKERFGERLNIEWSIAAGLEGVVIPTMTLQPLVENAVKHGIAPRRSGGRVRIAATREVGRLRLAVEDDGEGFPARYEEGMGLSNLRKRLETMYGAEASLRIESSASGSRVTVDLPVSRS